MVDQVLELAQYAGTRDRSPPRARAADARPPPSWSRSATAGRRARNIAIHRDAVRHRPGRDRPHDGRRRRRAQAHAAEPAHHAAGHRRPASDDRQRGSLTGSFTVRTSPAALRTRPGDPHRLQRRRAASSAAAAAASTVRRATTVRLSCGPLSVRLEERSVAVSRTVERAVLVAGEPHERAPPAVEPGRRRRAQERRAPQRRGGRPDRRAPGRAGPRRRSTAAPAPPTRPPRC